MTTGRRGRPAAAVLRMKRRGPGEVMVVDGQNREVATIHKQPGGRRWRVAMAPARVRTLSSTDPEFESRGAALAWLNEVQFN